MTKPFSNKKKISAAAPTDLIELGHITGAFGVRGMVKIKPYSADSALTDIENWWLRRRSPNANRAAQIDAAKAPQRLFQMNNCRWHSDHLIASLEGVSDRDLAEDLKGMVISVSRADFPQTDSDEFYWIDLLDCWVYTVDEDAIRDQGTDSASSVLLGRVKELTDNGVHAVLHVDRYIAAADTASEPQPLLTAKGQRQQSLVPFVEAHVLHVDLAQRTIQVDWPLDF